MKSMESDRTYRKTACEKLPKMRRIVIVLLFHLLANGDEVSHALDVVGMRPVDILIEFQGRGVCAHPWLQVYMT